MRPLDFLGRIKVKLGIVIVLAVVAAFVVNEVGINSGMSRDLRIAIAVVLALIMVQLLARGMTRPLREMAAAAQTIAKGRYGLRVTATSRDEVGELARAFNAMAADLAEVDRQRRELVANVSHELRTPITGLQAVLENVVDGVTPPDLDILGTALAQTQRLGRLVTQLLDLSRLDSGARLIEPEELDLASLCRQAASEATLARDDVMVVSTVAPGTVLSADPALLAQVLANLLDNAVRHSPPGGTVRVEARPAGPNLEIGVVDEGPGIPQAERARVFERFWRLDAGRAADAGGAGLGLAIAKEIVELHGGSIFVADPVPAVRRPEGEGRGTAPGCRMAVVLPRHGEPATGEGTGGSGHAGKADTWVRKPGMVHGAAEGASGDGGGDPSRGAAAAGGPGETDDAATPPPALPASRESVKGQTRGDAGDAAQAACGDAAGSDARSADDPEGAGPSSSAACDGGERPGETRDAEQAAAPSRPTLIAEAGHARSADPGHHTREPGDSPAGVDGEERTDFHRPGLVRTRADQPDAVPPAGGTDAGAPGRFVPPADAPYDRAGHLARAALGAGLGMCGGFFAGLVGSVFLSGYFGGGPASLPLLLFVIAGAVAGAARGSSSVRRATAPAAGESGPPRHTAEPDSVPPSPPGTRESVPAAPRAPGHAERRPAFPGAPASGAQGAGWYPPPPVYVPPPLFPRPDLPDAPRWLLPAAASAGLVAAVALPYAQAGLGFALTAVALGAAAFPAVLPLRRGRITPWTVAFGLLAYALVSVALFRDAEWLVAPVLLAAFVVASLALSGGGRGWLGVIRGGISVAFALLPLPWFLAGPLRTLTRRGRVLPTLAGAAVAVVLLAVFGLLLSSADAVFSAFLHDLLRAPQWVQSLPLRAFVFCVFAALAGAAVLVGLRPAAEPAPPGLRTSLGRQVWVIPLAGLNLLFAAFVAVQITVLFGGNRRVLSTAGLTYAQYARSGFFELVTVSLFVLGVVAAAVALSRRRTRADRRLLAVLLGLLCAFTLVILASALHRLGLYTDAYGLSRLRASVAAAIWWLAAVFVLVLAAGAVRLFGGGISWFFRALVLLTGASLLAFAVWDPDARVAETQLTVRGVARLDHGYLSDLGAEAVPILDRLPEPDRSCVLRKVVAVNELDKPDPWNGWNLARARAREVLERRPVLRGGDCPDSARVPGPYD